MEGNHWLPACNVNRRTEKSALSLSEGYTGEEPPVSPPVPITGPTLIIWSRADCSACRANARLFDRLRRQPGRWHVVQVEATADMVKRYPHIRVLPTFDAVELHSDGLYSPYGPGYKVQSIPNTARGELARLFPTVLSASEDGPIRDGMAQG